MDDKRGDDPTGEVEVTEAGRGEPELAAWYEVDAVMQASGFRWSFVNRCIRTLNADRYARTKPTDVVTTAFYFC